MTGFSFFQPSSCTAFTVKPVTAALVHVAKSLITDDVDLLKLTLVSEGFLSAQKFEEIKSASQLIVEMKKQLLLTSTDISIFLKLLPLIDRHDLVEVVKRMTRDVEPSSNYQMPTKAIGQSKEMPPRERNEDPKHSHDLQSLLARRRKRAKSCIREIQSMSIDDSTDQESIGREIPKITIEPPSPRVRRVSISAIWDKKEETKIAVVSPMKKRRPKSIA